MSRWSAKQRAQIDELKLVFPNHTRVEQHEDDKWAVLQLVWQGSDPKPILVTFDHYITICRLTINPPVLREWAVEVYRGDRPSAFFLSDWN